jgi:hypothetical protein
MTSLETDTSDDITEIQDEATMSDVTMQITATERELKESENADAQSLMAISDEPQDVNFDTFTCFRKLPFEIQRKIWYVPQNVQDSCCSYSTHRSIL